MYFGGIVIAGLFTFLPGRIMNAVVFSGDDRVALVSGLLLLGAAAAIVVTARQRPLA